MRKNSVCVCVKEGERERGWRKREGEKEREEKRGGGRKREREPMCDTCSESPKNGIAKYKEMFVEGHKAKTFQVDSSKETRQVQAV